MTAWWSVGREEYRVLVTGSEDWSGSGLLYQTLARYLQRAKASDCFLVVAHGGAPDGVDAMALEWVKHVHRIYSAPAWHHAYPVSLTLDGEWPHSELRRNARMLREFDPHTVLAFLCRGSVRRSEGARDCIERAYARKRLRELSVVWD